MNPEKARDAYIKLSRTGRHAGPFVFYDDAERSEVQNIYEEIGEANASVTRVAFRPKIVSEPDFFISPAVNSGTSASRFSRPASVTRNMLFAPVGSSEISL
jgi:hypothetical protein